MQIIRLFCLVFVSVEAFPTENGLNSTAATSPKAILFNHGGFQREITYELDSSLSDKERCLAESVLFNLMSLSCIRFRAKTSENSAKFLSFIKQNPTINTSSNYHFVALKSNDSYNSTMQKVLKSLNLRSNLKTISLSFGCSSPLNLSMDFVRQLVQHYRGCKSYLNISSELTRSSPKVEDSLVRNTRSTPDITQKMIHGDIMVRRRKLKGRRLQAVDNIIKLWPHWGEIPYELAFKSLEKQHKCLLKSAMLQIMLNTCIRYRVRNPEDQYERYLNVTDDSAATPGCWGTIGFEETFYDAALVSLPPNCMNIGTVMHEFLHALGFYHHQSRPDRDEYLHIYGENIHESIAGNFDIYGKTLTRWDYNSVMLYGDRGPDNKVTMKPKRAGVVLKDVSDKLGLTALDTAAINRLYKCKSSASTWLESNLYENGYFMKLFSELVDDDCHAQESSESHLYVFVD